MKWEIMTEAELHAFGIDLILPHLENEGVTVKSVNRELGQSPQILGERWGSLAFIYVKTVMYPSQGELSDAEFAQALDWADKHRAMAFLASVGLYCCNYPDKSPVTDEEVAGTPIRHAGFYCNYEGLLVMTTSERVKDWGLGD